MERLADICDQVLDEHMYLRFLRSEFISHHSPLNGGQSHRSLFTDKIR